MLEIVLKGNGKNGGENLMMGLARLQVLSKFHKNDYKVVFTPDEDTEYDFTFDDPQTQAYFEECISKVVTEIGRSKNNL